VILTINRPMRKGGPVKLYANVKFSPEDKDTLEHVEHSVVFLRTKNMKRWQCDCKDFLFRKAARRRHCSHIKAVRAEIARISKLKESK
jgi:hypothetical protein